MTHIKPGHACHGAAPALGPYQWWQRADVQALDEVSPLVDMLADDMNGFGYSEKDVFAVKLAFHEAITNAVKHGHRHHPDKRVHVSYLVTPEQVLAEILDEGPGFDPKQLPDPLAPENLEKTSGRGVFLMRAYMSWVQFIPPGNCVRLCKRRSD